MKYFEIEKKYTEIIADYLTKGYTLNTVTMSGTQGELAKVDLTNKVEVIRVRIERFSDYSCGSDLEGVKIIVGRSNKPYVETNRHEIIWNNEVEVISEIAFYAINRMYSRNSIFGTMEEAKAAAEKRFNRWKARNCSTEKVLIPSTTLIRALKSRKGFTNATRNNISVCRKERGYLITMQNRNGGIAKTELIKFENN